MSGSNSWQCDKCGRMFYQDFPPGCCDNCGGVYFTRRGFKDSSFGKSSGSGFSSGIVFFLLVCGFRCVFRFFRWVFRLLRGIFEK